MQGDDMIYITYKHNGGYITCPIHKHSAAHMVAKIAKNHEIVKVSA